MTSRELSELVIQKANIIDIIGEIVELKATKGGHWGLCPFHDDKHASMSVINRDKQKMYNCFSCGEKGNVINFYSKYYGISYFQATIKLAKKLGIPVDEAMLNNQEKNENLYKAMKEATDFYQFYLLNSLNSEKAMAYLEKRGLNEEIIEEFKIGLAPNEIDNLAKTLTNQKIAELDQLELGLVNLNSKNQAYDCFKNRIMFPITDEFGRTIAFSGRIYLDEQVKESKYINSKESPIFKKGNSLYHLDVANRNLAGNKPIYIMEGQMDVIAASICGVKTAVASLGTAFTVEHVKKILNLTKLVTICFDGDSAGIKALRKAIGLFSKENVIPNAVIIPDGLDPDEYLHKYGKEALKDFLENQQTNAVDTIYNFEFGKIKKDNILTIEHFKNEMFETIILINQKSMIEYYLKKMSADLNLEYDSLYADFNNYHATYSVKQIDEAIYDQPQETKSQVKKRLIKNRYYASLDGIIYLIYSNKHYYLDFVNQDGPMLLLNNPEAQIYHDIYLQIEEFYDDPDNSIVPNKVSDVIKNQDSKNYEKLLSIVESHTLETKEYDDDQAFNDYLNNIKEFNRVLKHQKLLESSTDEKSLIDSKKAQVTIKKIKRNAY